MLRHDRGSSRRRTPRRAAAAAVLSAAVGACLFSATAAGPASAARDAAAPWKADGTASDDHGMMFETFSPGGRISLRTGGPDHAPAPLPIPKNLRLATVGTATPSTPTLVPMHANGPTANRIDLIFIGDGYLASEMPVFARSAENAWQALIAYEPYKTYQNFFNASRIEVPSPVSGISNDPANGVVKQTPLGMHFWCHNIDRLLCVNTKAAGAYAALVPGVSHVVSIAHTATYGGAGGSITTLSGENQYSDGVIVHEMAHTVGGLGDEYQVPYGTSTGAEAGDLANVTSRTADYMLVNRHKWWRWIGRPSPDGSVVGAYPGANYYAVGFFRPSLDSEMRTLGRPFNPPSAEALIESFYVSRSGKGSIDPIEAVTPVPDSNGIVNRHTTLSAALVPLVGQNYTVYWGVDGAAVPGSLGRASLDLATAPLKHGQWNQVSLYVVDANPAVLDERFRAENMSKTRRWWVWGG
ncbi:MAG: M64 family metallopeptidase [Catenulispora sp.]